MALDDLLVAVEHELEARSDLVVPAARRDQLLAARQLGGFPEEERHTVWIELVEGVADRRVGADPRGGVRLPALGGDPQVLQRPLLAPQLGGRLQELLRGLRRALHRLRVAVALNPEIRNRLAGLRDAIGDALRPAVLDPDHHHRGDVGIGASADQRAEVKLEIGAELQPPVRMRQSQRALDVVLHRLRRGAGEIVHRKDDHVIAHPHAPVLAPVAPEARPGKVHCHFHHRFVLKFCTWACSPLAIGATTLPMSTPYLITVSPGL